MQQSFDFASMSLAAKLRLATALVAIAMVLVSAMPWGSYGSTNSWSLIDNVSKSEYRTVSAYAAVAFMFLALAVILVACLPVMSPRDERVKGFARGILFGVAGSVAVYMLALQRLLGDQTGLSVKDGLWASLVLAGTGIALSAWTVLAVSEDAPGAQPAASGLNGFAWGIALAYFALQDIELGENYAQNVLSHYHWVQLVAVYAITTVVGLLAGALPAILSRLRSAGALEFVSGRRYDPYGAPHSSAWNNGYRAISRAGGIAAPGTEYMPAGPVTAAPPVFALDGPRLVRARYNGVVVWQDWQQLTTPLDRADAGASYTVTGDAGAYFEVETASGQRGFVSKKAVQ